MQQNPWKHYSKWLGEKSVIYQQILKSEENVQRVQNVIENEYSNPFSFMDECETFFTLALVYRYRTK